MLTEVCDAFRSAGVPEDQARAAATAVAGQQDFEARLDRLGPAWTGSTSTWESSRRMAAS